MSRRTKVVARVLALALVVPIVSLFAEPAAAVMAPKTLSDQRPVARGPVTTGFPIDYVGVVWDVAADEADHAEEEGPEAHGAVRFRHDGTWGPWQPFIEDGAQAAGTWTSGLVDAGDAEAYQVRGVPADAGAPRVSALNTTDGPMTKVAEVRGGSAQALASTKCKSRADWGANEDLRFKDGAEVWPARHYKAQALTVHHTATKNNDSDPEATVRAIYRYHAVDNGWGDIGYQYLIDESGNVYEGRWSGAASTSCKYSGGTGADFGHEEGDADGDLVSDEMVTGAHTNGANSGNMGVSLLGEFTTHPRTGGDPKAAAVASLEDVLAELSTRHGLDPTKLDVQYVNPVDGTTKTIPTISGHQDWNATECPGERLYGQLPTIRQNVKTKMATTSDPAPTVAITSPADGAVVAGAVSVAADASTDSTQVEFYVDALLLSVDTDATDGWSAAWDTTSVPEGGHALTAKATDAALQTTTSAAVNVTVDNVVDETVTVRVADLAASTTSAKNAWEATVTIAVTDTNGNAVEGVTVSGIWSHSSSTVTCTTDAAGKCQVKSGRLSKSTSSVTYSVTNLSKTSTTYDATQNTESSITVVKPS